MILGILRLKEGRVMEMGSELHEGRELFSFIGFCFFCFVYCVAKEENK